MKKVLRIKRGRIPGERWEKGDRSRASRRLIRVAPAFSQRRDGTNLLLTSLHRAQGLKFLPTRRLPLRGKGSGCPAGAKTAQAT